MNAVTATRIAVTRTETAAAGAAERIQGVREDLPPGEHVLWQGSPSWQFMARHVFHVRQVAIYFVVLAAASAAMAAAEGQSPVAACATLVAMGAAACALLSLLAWLSARTTIYAITTRRVFMKIGIALPGFVNLPLHDIESAAVATYGGGHGDLPLLLEPRAHIAYLHLWPHARPWHVKRPEPMLRGVADSPRVAAILAAALRTRAADAAAG
ncbi:MAG TPA: photosynthetic complex putative assembly protein PuhB [Burkholderiaceae bacterium]|nr:photosynthetic complex putative assembly protein PuhB [Burkholderiaceae bacterium]